MNLRLIILFLFIFLIFLYTCIKLVNLVHFKRKGKILIWFFVFLFFFLSVAWQFFYRFNPDLTTSWIQTYYWISSVILGLLATFLTLAIPFDVLIIFSRALLRISSNLRKGKKTPVDYERRRFIAQTATMGLLGTSSAISILGVQTALRGPLLLPHTFKIPKLHPDLRGFKIIQISDLHVGPNILKNEVENVVRMVNLQQPDLVAITGDLGDGKISSLYTHLAPLADLKSKFGTFYVTGNHEYYWNANDWTSLAKKLNMKPLLNENEIIEIRNAKLLIGGVTDPTGEWYIRSHVHNPFMAAKTSQKVDLKMLLAHRPTSCYEAQQAGFQLQLSGHTHGGQFFPWSLFLPLAYQYYKGPYFHKDMALYVNAGTGYWGPPNRFAIPSEISLLTLT